MRYRPRERRRECAYVRASLVAYIKREFVAVPTLPFTAPMLQQCDSEPNKSRKTHDDAKARVGGFSRLGHLVWV